MRSSDYLVWIDLEMTGLNPAIDTILEIATLITDNTLSVVAQGPSIVIKTEQAILSSMNEWCIKHHAQSGLTHAAQYSPYTLEQAQHQTLEFLKMYCEPHTAPLCGSSVWVDRVFLQRHMPLVEHFLHYKIIDVSSIKEVVRRWHPYNKALSFQKNESHRALDDIKESIESLRLFKEHAFKS